MHNSIVQLASPNHISHLTPACMHPLSMEYVLCLYSVCTLSQSPWNNERNPSRPMVPVDPTGDTDIFIMKRFFPPKIPCLPFLFHGTHLPFSAILEIPPVQLR